MSIGSPRTLNTRPSVCGPTGTAIGPSILSWSLHNECYNHQDGVREATEEHDADD